MSITHDKKQAAPGSTGPHLYDDAGGGRHTMHHLSSDASSTASATTTSSADAEAMTDSALSRRLLPLYLVFVLDAVGLGVALPVLPFYVMGLKATALQLAIVVSTNYIAQTFGEPHVSLTYWTVDATGGLCHFACFMLISV